jgi:hypothetical protein
MLKYNITFLPAWISTQRQNMGKLYDAQTGFDTSNVLQNTPIVVFKGIVETEKESYEGEKRREGNQCGMERNR